MDNILSVLKQIFSEVLLCSEEELNLVKPYVDMGVDSILAIQVAKLIKLKLNKEIQPSELYNLTCIQDLSAYLEQQDQTSIGIKHQDVKHEDMTSQQEIIDDPSHDPIVIIGMAGYFPGASTIDEFWQNIKGGMCSMTKSTRWGDSVFTGGFLTNIDQFDAKFFSISPKEAKAMDPQQRLLLQVAWQTFEDAGYTKDILSGSKCGVFTTALPGDYRYLLQSENQAYSTYSFTGNAVSVHAGRIAHFFNLKGPCMNIDTACSSSLVCVNEAVRALEAKDCDTAFVGASSVFCTPELFKLAQSAGILSSSGRCYSFDSRADGLVPAEAVVGLVLTRLSTAMYQNRHIYGVIDAITVNHDGFTNGLMSPNGNSQRDLISSTYAKYGIRAEDIAYIEAHGTGTNIGDPLEFNALSEALQNNSKEQVVCYLGSCKANIGHALVASGLVSIIKVLLSFQNNEIPGQINFSKINPQIKNSPLLINTETLVWPSAKTLAGISAFGFGGTNAHLVLKKIPQATPSRVNDKAKLFIFSAHTQAALKNYIHELLPFLDKLDETHLENLSYTLCCCRQIHDIRLVIVSSSVSDLATKLKSYVTEGIYQFDESNEQIWFYGNKIKNGEKVSCYPLFQGKHVNLHLPPYLFRGESYWVNNLNNAKLYEENKNTKISNTLEIIKQRLSEILGYNAEDISSVLPIQSFGIDSLVALQLLEPFKKQFGSLSTDIIFRMNSLQELADSIDNCSFEMTSKTDKEAKSKRAFQLKWTTVGSENAPQLLMLPPLNANHSIWEPQLHYFLRKGYQIHIPSYPGHDRSTDFDFDLRQLSEIIWNEFKQQANGQQKVNIFGWSLGGCLSLLLASQYPDEISKVILINTAAKFDRDIFSQSSQLRAELEDKKIYINHLFDSQDANAVDLITAGCSLEVLKKYYEQLSQFNAMNIVNTINVPCLVMYGERDTVINRNDLEDLLNIPSSSVELFSTDGHFIPLTSPYKFNVISEEFMAYN